MRKNHPHARLPYIGRSPRRVIQFLSEQADGEEIIFHGERE